MYSFFVQPFLKLYLKKPRTYCYKKLRLIIQPGVFHPAYFFSTTVFSEFLEAQDLSGLKLCEVGAGSGLLSFIAHTKGAEVTAFDISATAVKGLQENLKANFAHPQRFSIYLSDLFEHIPPKVFDVLLINPPYFFKDPKDEAAYAWYCGKNGEYFKKLFSRISVYTHADSSLYLILAENCDMKRIEQMATQYNYVLEPVFEKKIKWEKNTIFKLRRNGRLS